MNHTPPEQATTRHTHPLFQDPHLTGIAPRWTISIGILFTGVIYLVLDSRLKIGPDWALLAIELALLLPLWIFWITGHTLSYPTTRIISFVLLGFVTAGLVLAVIFLIHDLTHFKRGFTLLQTAGLLWVFNVLVFALWYWHTDSGGPRKRHEFTITTWLEHGATLQLPLYRGNHQLEGMLVDVLCYSTEICMC